jgi:hypothetical protein
MRGHLEGQRSMVRRFRWKGKRHPSQYTVRYQPEKNHLGIRIPPYKVCITRTLEASGVADSENLRKRMTVNQIAINVRMANGNVIPMN